MYAYRQIQQVQNRTVIVELPKDFPTDKVEVIVLPAQQSSIEPAVVKADERRLINHFLTIDTSHFSAKQQKAYERSCTIIKRGRNADEPRLLGLFAGLVEVADDFDAPLADEGLFWGEGTNEIGMSYEVTS